MNLRLAVSLMAPSPRTLEMLLHTRLFLVILLAAGLTVIAIPAPLGHTTPKYASSRIIFRETPSTTEQKHGFDFVDRADSSHYRRPKFPYHANLNFGDDDDDGPEVLPAFQSSKVVSRPKFRRQEMNYVEVPQPVRRTYGASLGRQNVLLEEQISNLLSPPKTDLGKVNDFKWPFSLSHNRLTQGGWARQQNEKRLPFAKDLAAVNMRLKAGAIREMHWQVTDEWAYVLKGSLRVSVLSPGGNNEGVEYGADVNEGDLWYFPAGNAHSIQAKDTLSEGAEFLLILNAGAFDETDTFLLTDWLTDVPNGELAKNFGTHPDTVPSAHIPEHELYISPSNPPQQQDINEGVVTPNTTDPKFFSTYPLSKVTPTVFPGGTIKIADSRNFEVAKKIAVAEISVEIGAMRELHWHPTQPEWTLILKGKARITLFAAWGSAATYDFFPGDVAYIPPSFGHYIENIGDEPLKFLEILKTDVFQDISP